MGEVDGVALRFYVDGLGDGLEVLEVVAALGGLALSDHLVDHLLLLHE